MGAVAELLVVVQRSRKMFVHHGRHVTGVVGEHHAVDGHVLRMRRRASVPRPRVVLHVVVVLVHLGANICGDGQEN